MKNYQPSPYFFFNILTSTTTSIMYLYFYCVFVRDYWKMYILAVKSRFFFAPPCSPDTNITATRARNNGVAESLLRSHTFRCPPSIESQLKLLLFSMHSKKKKKKTYTLLFLYANNSCSLCKLLTEQIAK